jgi:hypothetical protein
MAEETKEAKSLASAAEVLKATLVVATGTLVFSAGLLKENIHLSCLGKWLLGISWFCLGISIVTGSVAHLRVPVMIAEDKPDIHDKWFKSPGQIHHIAFIFGVIFLGAAMIAILATK